MPSDSAAAGLIALGVIRRYMELDHANDKDSHYQRLLELARSSQGDVVLRQTRRGRGRFIFDGIVTDGFRVKQLNSGPSNRKWIIVPEMACDWHIVGEPPVVLANGQKLYNSQFYSQLVPMGKAIKERNLVETHSCVCLAGCVKGEVSTKDRMADIRFRDNGDIADLSQLLTIRNWISGTRKTISRLRFYNARTETFDRESDKPQVVVADGDASFLKIISKKEFEDCDVIGVVHRTMERENLEEVGEKLSSLRQWYDTDESFLRNLPDIPRGITILAFRRGA